MAPPNRIMASDGWITPFPSCPCIRLIIKTRMFAANLKNSGVGVNDVWVERLKEGWESNMLALLDSLFNGTWVQKVLFVEIERRCKIKNFKVSIWPREYHPEVLDPSKGEDEVINLYLNAAEEGRQAGLTGPSKLADPGANTAGGGDNALIYFDPDTWRTDSFIRQVAEATNTSQYTGVGMDGEDVLFHEMVHALRSLKGVTDRTPTITLDYVSVEEFAAGLITNIAMNEKKPYGELRYGELNFKRMPPQYKTSAGFLQKQEHVDLIKRIYVQDISLFHNIAGSPNPHPFNPIRRFLRGALWTNQMADW